MTVKTSSQGATIRALNSELADDEAEGSVHEYLHHIGGDIRLYRWIHFGRREMTHQFSVKPKFLRQFRVVDTKIEDAGQVL